jgi:hypothetical protein
MNPRVESIASSNIFAYRVGNVRMSIDKSWYDQKPIGVQYLTGTFVIAFSRAADSTILNREVALLNIVELFAQQQAGVSYD